MNVSYFHEDHIRALYQKYESELCSDLMGAVKVDERGRHDGGISRVDGELVYMLMRELGVRNAIEFSPNEGYSTAFVYAALQANSPDSTFATFDLEVYPAFLTRMSRLGMEATIFRGDALVNIPRYLDTRELTGKIDFCFIDSDHSYDFAKRYCKELFPLLGPRCVFYIHDMCYRPHDFQNFSHYGQIHGTEIGGTGYSPGEAAYLCEFFSACPGKYLLFSTHKLFGDSHEYSSILPRNLPLIEALEQTIEGFQLPPSAGQEGGIPRCPMGLFVFPMEVFE
jgi:predicted O-methyltransferase YrrM